MRTTCCAALELSRARRAARPLLATLLMLGVDACRPQARDKPHPPASASPAAPIGSLPDLSKSLDAVRAVFNRHSKQARFLTLLSPA